MPPTNVRVGVKGTEPPGKSMRSSAGPAPEELPGRALPLPLLLALLPPAGAAWVAAEAEWAEAAAAARLASTRAAVAAAAAAVGPAPRSAKAQHRASMLPGGARARAGSLPVLLAGREFGDCCGVSANDHRCAGSNHTRL